MKRRIAFIVDNPDFLLSHRKEVVLNAFDNGFEVHVICSPGKSVERLKAYGFQVHSQDVARGKMNPLHDLFQIYRYTKILRTVKPSIVHLITIKPYLYGGIAARIAKVPAVVTAVAGLGILFSSTSFKHKILRVLLMPLFKLAFNHANQIVIFQNHHDRDTLISGRIVSPNQVRMIRGSGVNLSLYPLIEEPDGIPKVAFAARLLKDKGVEQFIEAARGLRDRGVDAEFLLIGRPDTGNANSVSQPQLDQWAAEGLVKVLGYRSDITALFSESNIVTLPSFYGEGLPKVLIEAAACGRAVVTTDHPGCRDAIEPGVTGLLVPTRDAKALTDAIQDLIENPEKRKRMGIAGRKLAEQEFTIENVTQQHLEIYLSLLRK